MTLYPIDTQQQAVIYCDVVKSLMYYFLNLFQVG